MPAYVNPLEDMVQGIFQAHSVANMVKRAAMEKQKFEADQEEAARRRVIDDINTRLTLVQNTRPVPESGLIVDEADLGGFQGKVPVARKPTNTVSYGGQRYEILSPEEQATKQEALQRRLGEIANALHAQRIRDEAAVRGDERDKELERTGLNLPPDVARILGVPPGQKVPITAMDDAFRAAAALKQMNRPPEDPVHSVSMQVDQNGNVVPVRTYKSGKVEVGSSLGPIGKPSPPPKQPKARELTPGQEGVAARATQRRIDAVQRQHDEADAKEQTLHAEAIAAGERLKAISKKLEQLKQQKGDEKLKETEIRELNAERRKLEARLPFIQEQAKTLNEKKKSLLRRKETMRPNAAAAGDGGEVNVRLPNGTRGTIPRANLDRAKKLGAVEIR